MTAHRAWRARLSSSLLWAGQIALASFFVFAAALPKLTGGGSHGAVQEFGLIGAGQWFRYFVGTLELAGAIGLLTPWLAGLAAAGLAADMAGASIINATVLHNTRYDAFWMTVVLCAMLVLLAYGRRQQIKRLVAAIHRKRLAQHVQDGLEATRRKTDDENHASRGLNNASVAIEYTTSVNRHNAAISAPNAPSA